MEHTLGTHTKTQLDPHKLVKPRNQTLCRLKSELNSLPFISRFRQPILGFVAI